MIQVEAHDWDARYRGATLLWTERPNQLLVEEISGLNTGRALDLGAGEGRNAVWLAEQGWKVTAVDFSRVAIERGAAIAQRAGVEVEWVQADLTEYRPATAAFDLVVILYLHLPPEARRRVLEQAVAALYPGGRLLIVGHDLENLAGGHGGPQEPSVLYTPARIAAELPGLTIARTETVKRHVRTIEGTATAYDTVVLAVRPVTQPGNLATVTARWSGTPYQFDITGPRGQVATVDEPPLAGRDQGMKPSELLLGRHLLGHQCRRPARENASAVTIAVRPRRGEAATRQGDGVHRDPYAVRHRRRWILQRGAREESNRSRDDPLLPGQRHHRAGSRRLPHRRRLHDRR